MIMMMNHSSCFRCRTLFSFYGVCALLVLLAANTAQGTTYYVATTGSDSNPGTSALPWLTIQKCVAAGSPLVAGDTCQVANGTYTSSTSGIVVNIGSSSPAGTATKPITIRAANRAYNSTTGTTQSGARIVVPNSWPGANCEVSFCAFSGFYITRPFYIIDGFEITRPGAYQGAMASSHGVFIIGAEATGAVIRNNHFHDIARNVCSDGVYGNTGSYADGTSNILYENNLFHTIGRRLNGEAGCVTVRYQTDQGIYVNNVTDLTIRRNVFFDITRGLPINTKSYTGAMRRLKIYNNVLADPGQPWGAIQLANALDDVQIKNNIFHKPGGDCIIFWYQSTISPTSPGVVLDHNLSTAANTVLSCAHLKPSSGITETGNLTNTAAGFVDATARNYLLAPGSAAINRGTTVGVPPVKDGAPDIGAYEFGETASALAPPTGLRVQ